MSILFVVSIDVHEHKRRKLFIDIISHQFKANILNILRTLRVCHISLDTHVHYEIIFLIEIYLITSFLINVFVI